ncbi:MAG TPA: tetratricopeptide repeat protein [Candidatus Dormibacteraeota bacterium]|nr:tetratricopeptide repeat protein [Candidatus Dormibacteraeota bacterium]
MSELPTGTITFFFSDIAGSTRLIQQLGSEYPDALLAHHAIQRQALAANGGHELRTEGDSFFVVFDSAVRACAGAAAVQKLLAEHDWPAGSKVLVRVGLHTGEATLVGNEYLGIDVHRAARVAGAANGGQVLLSETTRTLVGSALPAGLSIKDLGVHRLKDLARPERLFQLTIEGLPSEFPALRTLEATPNNLPTQMTSFIGRDDQVREAKALLGRSRLLTLTGPGGTGKTRLSLQLATDVLDQFPDGVFFVPLAAVTDPELVPSAIAQALAVQSTGTRRPIDVLLDYLHDKRTLLVLDNFEQLLAAAPVTTTLLEASPDLRLVVSSRAVLRVYGEQEFPVPPLGLPDTGTQPTAAALSQFEAVRLFIERAVAAKPDFQATNANAPAIAGICERVDGLPLAIELAAARVRLFSPQALLGRLEKTLTALGTGARDLPTRQQTLRGAIQWSHDLLDDAGRRVFERFSVFGRGASLLQAEQVCGPTMEIGGEVLDRLDQLADQSLLRRVPEFDEPRFLMLQTIREFAADRLEVGGEAASIKDRHVKAYLALAREAQPHLFGSERKAWLDRLAIEQDNFRAALDWTITSGDSRNAMQLAACLWRFWQMRGHIDEGRARLTIVLGVRGGDAFSMERLEALEAAGSLAYWQADMETAQTLYDQCLELTRRMDNPAALAHALYNAAFPSTITVTDVERSRRLLEEALPIYRSLNDQGGVARTLWTTANTYHFQHRDLEARTLMKESEALFRKLDDRFGLAWCLHSTGQVLLKLGDVDGARRSFMEAVTLFQEANDLSGIVLQLDNLAEVIRRDGDPYRGARLASAGKTLQAATGASLGALLSKQEGRTGREGLSEAEAARALAEGQRLTIEEALQEALAAANKPPAPAAN